MLVKREKWGWIKSIAIGVLFIFVLARVYYALTDDFRLSNITYVVPFEKSWDVTYSLNEEDQLEKILSQSFKYLGKGAQSYVFASDDGKYVLKFFKFKHLKPSLFVNLMPPVSFIKEYKEKQISRKHRKLFGVFRSYKLAYDEDKNESGLLFIQLNTQNNPKREVKVMDKIGFIRTIDLSRYSFIVQKRGETLKSILGALLQKGDIELAMVRLGQILDLYAREYSKGMYDHDHGVMQNLGFIMDTPIHLDVGKLMKEDKMKDKFFAKKDAKLVIDKITFWVKNHYPEYSKQIAQYLNDKINLLYN